VKQPYERESMYVVSINDCGEERNFLATELRFAGSQLTAIINGTQRDFKVDQLIDIESVDLFASSQSVARIVFEQRRLT
jgi:hypothetical protein